MLCMLGGLWSPSNALYEKRVRIFFVMLCLLGGLWSPSDAFCVRRVMVSFSCFVC